MKNVFHFPRLAVVALAALFTFAFSAPAFAGTGDENPAVELKFIGNLNSQPVYQLSLNNIEDGEYTIIIKDVAGEVLYSERAKGVNITRKFQLNTAEVDENALRFEIINRKNFESTVYELSKNTRTVQDVVVNKVK